MGDGYVMGRIADDDACGPGWVKLHMKFGKVFAERVGELLLTIHHTPLDDPRFVQIIGTNMSGDELIAVQVDLSQKVSELHAMIAEELEGVFKMILPSGQMLDIPGMFLRDALASADV